MKVSKCKKNCLAHEIHTWLNQSAPFAQSECVYELFYVLFASVLIGSLPEVIILLCLAHMVIFTLNRVLCIRLGCFVIPVVNYTYMYNVFKALPAN